MHPDQMMQRVCVWMYWLFGEGSKPVPYDVTEPRIPRKYWVDENNNLLFPEL